MIRENFTSLDRVIRRSAVQGYLGPRKFSIQINISLKTRKVLSQWRKLISLGSSYPGVERD